MQGNVHNIPDWRIQEHVKDRYLLGFKSRPWEQRGTPENIARLSEDFAQMAKQVRFRLGSGYTCWASGLPVREVYNYGETTQEIAQRKITVEIALELLQPLLRDDLTDAERYVGVSRDEFRID